MARYVAGVITWVNGILGVSFTSGGINAAQLTIGWDSILTVSGASIFVGAVVAVVVDKRRKDLIELYKGLYEGKEKENHELETRIVKLESRIELYESDFTKKLAEGITEAIMRSVHERLEADKS